MKPQKGIRLAFALLKRNWRSILAFEAVYKLATAIIVMPVLYGLFSASMRLAGLTYISNDTLRAYLFSPGTAVCLIVLLLIVTLVSLVDIEAVVCCYHAAYYDERMSCMQMLKAGFAKARRVFRWKNLIAAVFVLLIVPLTNVAAVSGFISGIEIPEFIRDFIDANKALYVLYRLVRTGLALLAFVWALSMQAFTLENVPFGEAARRSAALMKGRYLKTAFRLLLWQFLLLLAGLVIQLAVTGIAFLGIRFFCAPVMQYTAATTALLLMTTAGSVLLWLLSVPFAFASLSAAYYTYKRESGQEIARPEAYPPPRPGGPAKKMLAVILCLAAIVNVAILVVQQYNGYYGIRNALARPEIAAHRGSSTQAPENSIPAFEQAIREGADWIELDVHQTGDGVVVVAHDESIKRIAGVDQNIWALTYDELKQYDVGSWFSPEFRNLRIATLDEVLKLCKGKIKLNIELKPTGHEPDFERHVIDLLRENEYRRSDYILASLNADALQTVKRLDPEEETLFIMAIAAGHVTDIPFADAFSIEESSIDEALVDSIHAAGKRIHAWTINREQNVENMMKLRVDCIITDNPVMVRRVMNENSMQEGLRWMVAQFFQPDEEIVRPDAVPGP